MKILAAGKVMRKTALITYICMGYHVTWLKSEDIERINTADDDLPLLLDLTKVKQ
ncbi:MAG: hypothetical protein HFF02_01335 [Erysipelotrichaceae bacterium]|nr:hypothetical protein [Erysipelotrichaceae bacterium]